MCYGPDHNQKYRAMSFTLEYRETNRKGSFVARSSNFLYNYCASNNQLGIHNLDPSDALRTITLGKRALCNPLQFTQTFDKTAKIKALTFSSNQTIRLPKTMAADRVAAFLPNIEHLTRYACMLESGNVRDFCNSFAQDHVLKAINIQKIALGTDFPYYRAELCTLHNHEVAVRAESLHKLLQELSAHVMQDLAMVEFGHSHHGSAQNLLTVSAKLSTLSRILNDDFIPEFQLAHRNDTETAAEA